MATFLVVLSRDTDVSDDMITAHRAFLADLRAEKRLGLAGPFKDVRGGAYILEAETLSMAQEEAARDPLISEGIAQATVHEWAAHA
ncbi:YciI family protein [Larsenimonas rhizosphaerae]|uniref:YciI family protein n=1 Tax=Larsenimonas rhizosphaerae TaxID=2944682 RepID=A0AA41ZEZ8_9GAMM|nr:YciI family protein [Larsenimonas rhizosphaerae]MCM2129964.1 YciI family protein [Larsenimonas rhizosphaerae]MCX2522663.1 YciI family protein [Larsenimonas rhizosphaerae]